METQMLCRICFEMGHFCLNGYEMNVQGNNLSVEKMIQRFSDIEIVVDGNAPEMICEACTHDLVQSYLFAEKIQQADARILNLFRTQLQEPTIIVCKEEVLSQKDPQEESSHENQERFTDEDEDITKEDTKAHIIEEIYLNAQCAEENDLIAGQGRFSVKRKYAKSPQIVLTEGVSNLLPNYETVKEEPDEPKQKVYCRKKDTRNKEVDRSGSFVIAQFTSSTASKIQLENMISDDTDEVALSDIRTMNFETVEVKANNMNVIMEDDQGELPIDEKRVYLCQYCPQAFSSSAFLISHVRKSHGCLYCAKLFEKSTELYKHIREEHTTFKCVICEKDFVSNGNLRNHLRTVHKLKVPANVALLSYIKDKKSTEVE